MTSIYRFLELDFSFRSEVFNRLTSLNVLCQFYLRQVTTLVVAYQLTAWQEVSTYQSLYEKNLPANREDKKRNM